MGTRGAALVGGARRIRIHGRWVEVRAEVASIEGLSAHADQSELLAWLDALPRAPSHVYITHGEPEPADALRLAIGLRQPWPCTVPDYRETVDVEPG
jgi:metallo-beta-lactamase family protein